MQKNQCHVQTWRDMFAGAGLSCFISLNQLLAFESSTEEDIYFWQRKAEGGYSHFKMTANLSLCFLFIQIHMHTIRLPHGQWCLRLCDFSGFNCILDHRHRTSLYLKHCECNCTIRAIQQITHIWALNISEY